MKIRSCPKCNGTLTDTEKRGVSYETCSTCKGHWFDSMALDVLFKKQLPGRNLGASEDFMSLPLSEPSTARCPRCTEPMMTGTQVDIAVEWCRHCKGIFLDEGELKRIVEWRQVQLKKERVATAKASASVAADFAIWIVFAGFFGKE